MSAAPCAIGVDLGGTKIELALVADDGRCLAKRRVLTHAEQGRAAVEKTIIQAVKELRRQQGARPVGIGIGVAGQIGADGAMVCFAPNLNWRDVPLQASLQRQLELPVAVLNDVRAATWGEWLFGAGQGCDDLVCLFVGTGIGGGVVSGGQMLRGAGNSAGELGHLTIDLHGPICHCGNRGCLEALAGGWAIARRVRQAVAVDPGAGAALLAQTGGEMEQLTAEHLAKVFHAGDPLASRLVDKIAEVLSAGAAGLVNAFNPQRLILGGGVIEGLPELVAMVDHGLRERALEIACKGLEVLTARCHNDAGVLGAAAVALRLFGPRQE